MPVQSSVVVHSLLGDTPNWKRCPHLLFFFRLSASICSLDFLMNIYKNSCNIECFHLFNFYVFFFSSVYLPSKKKKFQSLYPKLGVIRRFQHRFSWVFISFSIVEWNNNNNKMREKKTSLVQIALCSRFHCAVSLTWLAFLKEIFFKRKLQFNARPKKIKSNKKHFIE